MKSLETNFTANFDKSGNHNFLQIRRENNVALYRRESEDGSPRGFEVFFVRTIKAGSPLPGGLKVEEDYERYPTKNDFGRTAWAIGGRNAESLAIKKFEQLLKGDLPEVETEVEEEIVPVVRVSSKPVKDGLKIPATPFTQKELAAFNKIDNYKEVYSDLQKLLARGVLKIHEEKKAVTRGKAAKMFVKVG